MARILPPDARQDAVRGGGGELASGLLRVGVHGPGQPDRELGLQCRAAENPSGRDQSDSFSTLFNDVHGRAPSA